MNNENKKEITLEDLAALMKKGFEESDKRTDEKIDRLAMMVQKGFVENREYMDKRFDEINEKTDKGFTEVNSKIDNLELEVKNRRTHVFDHKDLEHRVEKLEEKTKKYDSLFSQTAKGNA